MPWTNVNRLAREIEEAGAVAKSFYNKHQAEAHGFHTMAQRNASWTKYQKALQKVKNLTEQLKMMNQGALQVQLAKIVNRRRALNKNLNQALVGYGFGKRNLVQNVFREYSHWNMRRPKNDPDIKNLITNENKETNWTPQLRVLKFKILENKIKNLPTNTIYRAHFKKIAPLAIQHARIGINEKALKKAVNLRKRHMGPEKAARNEFRSVGRRVLENNIKWGPAGTRTLEARRRFPGFREKTLENYAKLERERNRLLRNIEMLQRALAQRN